MSSTETLLKATINRLSARLGGKVVNSFSDILLIAKNTQEKLKTEWDIFQEEVFNEVERLDNEAAQEDSINYQSENNTIKKVDQLRSKISNLNKKINSQ